MIFNVCESLGVYLIQNCRILKSLLQKSTQVTGDCYFVQNITWTLLSSHERDESTNSSQLACILFEWFPGNKYMPKVNKGNNKKRCGKCSKLTIKTPERYCWGQVVTCKSRKDSILRKQQNCLIKRQIHIFVKNSIGKWYGE